MPTHPQPHMHSHPPHLYNQILLTHIYTLTHTHTHTCLCTHTQPLLTYLFFSIPLSCFLFITFIASWNVKYIFPSYLFIICYKIRKLIGLIILSPIVGREEVFSISGIYILLIYILRNL